MAEGLLYDVGLNVWVRLEGGQATLGMTDVAQTMGGRMVQLTWRRTGRVYERGRSLATIESAKWVGPFPTPLTGELIGINETAFVDDIAVANRDPYGAGWIARVRPTWLEEERAEFERFAQDLRRARDKEEFDRFMANRPRRSRPNGETIDL